MEKFTLTEDIPIFYITATSFPEGVLNAHQRLHSLVPYTPQRRYFGLSRPEQEQGIVYRAAVEELEAQEGAKLGCEGMIIPKGEYISSTVFDYMTNPVSISAAFGDLLRTNGLDPNGYCVEWYLDEKNVRCMIRLA